MKKGQRNNLNSQTFGPKSIIILAFNNLTHPAPSSMQVMGVKNTIQELEDLIIIDYMLGQENEKKGKSYS